MSCNLGKDKMLGDLGSGRNTLKFYKWNGNIYLNPETIDELF